jgi:hypothetical protein
MYLISFFSLRGSLLYTLPADLKVELFAMSFFLFNLQKQRMLAVCPRKIDWAEGYGYPTYRPIGRGDDYDENLGDDGSDSVEEKEAEGQLDDDEDDRMFKFFDVSFRNAKVWLGDSVIPKKKKAVLASHY